MRFPGFEGEWEEYKVSELLQFFPTNSMSWDQLEYGTGDIFNLHYGLIHKGLPTQIELNKCTLPNIKGDFIPTRYTLCKEGDVVFADASEDTNDVGKVVEFLNCDKKNVVCGLHTIHGRDKYDLTIEGFKGYAFSSKSFRSQIKKLAQGTKIYSISPKNFQECHILIPDKEEQNKIGKLLYQIDERISTQNKIIGQLETLIMGIYQKLADNKHWKKQYLRDILTERKETSKNNLPVFSVSVSKGVINQIEYLGRSFAAKNTANYNVVCFGDVVYTKSPTGEFPYGIIKQSFIRKNVVVSPLYAVYVPKDIHIGSILHYYFNSPINANNYLHSLIQKGAKNTINITNQRFLDNTIFLPTDKKEIEKIASLLNSINKKIQIEKLFLEQLEKQKTYLLQQIFV
ncbi:restriction endonuclease subunit S [Proteiniphilum sp.]|uniref:restriction endonuclease subunit S n=1 Tax=Proteiniphilum sp. TaxID=1926877 RepID=UPI002B1F1C2F|nr:restriction endonuclease subunit S [Proteiniphilum sp.]MEA4918707.1 restriction endonuclease subunit S [Proteiniphilum sp.]